MGKDSGAQRRGTSRGTQSWLERGMSVVGSGQTEAGNVGRSQITKVIVSDAKFQLPITVRLVFAQGFSSHEFPVNFQ